MSCSPGNPCHKTPLTDGCGVDPCNVEVVSTDKIIYTGPNLPCIGVDTCTTLTESLSLINSKMCPDNLVLALFSALNENSPICSEDKTNLCEPDCENCIPDNTMSVQCEGSLDVLCNIILGCITTTTTTTTAAPICVCYTVEGSGGYEWSYLECDGTPGGGAERQGTHKFCAQQGTVAASPTNPLGNVTISGGIQLCTSYLDCIPCYCYSVESSTIRGISIQWVDCSGNGLLTSGNSIPGGLYIVGCAQEDSVEVNSLDSYTISGGITPCTSYNECTTTTTTTAIPDCPLYEVCATSGNGGGFFQYYPCNSTNIVLECIDEGECIEVCADSNCGIIPVTNIASITIIDDCASRPTTTTTTTPYCSNNGGTAINTCACITFTNLREIPTYVLWDVCPGYMIIGGGNIPGGIGQTLKACGSNPRSDTPGAASWIIGSSCDKSQPFPACSQCLCSKIIVTSSGGGHCDVTYYNCYGEFVEETLSAGTYDRCIQDGSFNSVCIEATCSITPGGSCTSDYDCEPICECYEANNLLGCEFEYTQCDGTVVPFTGRIGDIICAQVGSISQTVPCLAPPGYGFFTSLGTTCTNDKDC
jgi:hypothetical protein